MNSFVDFWDSLGYNKFFLVMLGIFFLSHVISLLYRMAVLLSRKKPATREQKEGVSVIITCANKAEELKKNLPAFLSQHYPEYEVIVVDECSEDDTQDVLSELQQQYPHLRTSRIFPDTKFRRTKKIALHIGVLAAQYDILLFTEIHCAPESENWVESMQSYFTPDTAVVIGYSNYTTEIGGANIWRYFRFLWFWKMMVLARHGMYVMGNGTNMGYRKQYYLEKRGFSGNTQEYIGYDTEMVKELAQKGKIKIVKEADSRMSLQEGNSKTWKEDYSYYYATKWRWPWPVWLWSNLDFIAEMLFYGLACYFILTGLLHNYILIPVILTFLMDFIGINLCLKHLGQRKLFLTSLSVNTIGFIYKWYYSFYSIFTSKKWR